MDQRRWQNAVVYFFRAARIRCLQCGQSDLADRRVTEIRPIKESTMLRNESSKRREAEIYRGTARLPEAASATNPLVRLITDFGFTRRVVRYALGLPVPMETEDRHVLEEVIFKQILALPQTQRILFVGCDWYTKHYQQAFFSDRDYWTIDMSAKAAKFGARQHLTAGLQDLDRHFPERHFDVIFCNGVYGFGLDAHEQIERAID